jgi:hypothetical protein
MTTTSKILAGAFALALAPLALATSAAAAPHGGGMMMGGHRPDAMHDHGHQPPARAERRPSMPHGGHYKWRGGNWGWRNGQWAWTPGIWIRF